MKEILYLLLDKYADHEMSFLAEAIAADELGLRTTPRYINKIVATQSRPIQSLGGYRILPDYALATRPDDYAALVLVGGYGWSTPEADHFAPLVKEALKKGVPVGAICNAASWMAKQGFLNRVKHTGNGVEQLKAWGRANYTNEANYIQAEAVSDQGIVTANGTGQLEFACELLKLLQQDTPEQIERYRQFYKQGFTALFTPKPRFVFNTVGLFTQDNTRTVAFYQTLFGFQTDWDGITPNVEMHLGDMRIILFPRDAFEAMTSQRYGYPTGMNGTMELAFDVPSFADVDREYERAVSQGASPIFPPTTEPWGQRTCYIADPDGNLIEISSFFQSA